MSKKKNTFRKKWRTLTELGREFGVSAIKFGNLLKEHGLREIDGEPSIVATEGGYYEKIEPKGAKHYYLWHKQKTTDYLISRGVVKAGVSSKEATAMTTAKKLAKAYLQAKDLDDKGDKLGYLMLGELVDDIRRIGLGQFNAALKELSFKEDVTLDDW